MSQVVQDLKYAFRMFAKRPVFTAAGVLTLALGIGLNAAVFSAVHALLLRPLPGVHEPERLVQFYREWPGIPYGSNSIPHFQDMRDRTGDVFEDAAAWTFVQVSLATEDRSEMLMGAMVSANFFDVLGVRAMRGRTFTPDEATGPGAHPVVVLGHGLWQRRFGGDPSLVGRSITVNGQPFTVVGIAPEEFKGAQRGVEPALYVPLMMQEVIRPGRSLMEARGSNFLSGVARLRNGVTAAQAEEAMQGLLAGLREDHPDQYGNSGIVLVRQADAGIHPSMRDAQVGMSTVIMAVVGLLLLVACVNVANLFLARAGERRKEMGIRLSLGARRGRIVRQLLTESVVFSLLAGGAGVVLAWAAIRVGNSIRLPVDIPVSFDLALDPPVLAFTATVALLTGVVFGLVPALQASKPETVSALKGESAAGASRSRTSQGLVVAQMALSILLLVSAGLFVRNLQAATDVDKGFDSDNLLVAGVHPGLQGYTEEEARLFYRDLLERVRTLPGVSQVALGEVLPLGFSSQQTSVDVPGYEPSPDEQMSIDYNIVGPGYFEAMGIPVRGREFTEADEVEAPGVIVVNEHFARRFWPGEDPVGKIVRVGGERSVVGVVPTGKYQRLGEAPTAYMYLPFEQSFNYAMTVHVRTTGDPEALAPRLRQVVRSLDPNLPVYDVKTMNNHLGIALMPARLGGITLGLFGVLGLILAAVGIYGVTAVSVARRTREMGIRIALGAKPGRVLGLVVRQGLGITAVGIVIGLGAAFVAAGFVRDLLYTGQALDPVIFLGVPAVLGAVALLATWVPARRAAGVDPVRALKTE